MNITNTNEKPKFKIGDRDRIFKHKNKFEKGYRGYWTKEIFKITLNTLIQLHSLFKILNIENTQGSFYANEFQKTVFQNSAKEQKFFHLKCL